MCGRVGTSPNRYFSKIDQKIRIETGCLTGVATRIGNDLATLLSEVRCDVGMSVYPKIGLTQKLRPVIRVGCDQMLGKVITHVIQRWRMVRNYDGFAIEGLVQLI